MKQKKPDDVSIPSELGHDSLEPIYIRYGVALKRLRKRLEATPEEVAAWVFFGKEDGGLDAYLNANELNPPPRFRYNSYMSYDYLRPLRSCWFLEAEVESFSPEERFISGAALLARWNYQRDYEPNQFMTDMVKENRLMDIHPITGFSQAQDGDQEKPPIEECLFHLNWVLQIEKEEGFESPRLDVTQDAKGGNESQGQTIHRNETPEERGKRLHDRQEKLKAQGIRDFQKRVANEEGCSKARVKQLIAAYKKDLKKNAPEQPQSTWARLKNTPLSK